MRLTRGGSSELMQIVCPVHGGRMVPPIAPVGPTMTRPSLRVFVQLRHLDSDPLWEADPDCRHYVTYAEIGGIWCVRCGGWYCL
jgi:hypothetical protein